MSRHVEEPPWWLYLAGFATVAGIFGFIGYEITSGALPPGVTSSELAPNSELWPLILGVVLPCALAVAIALLIWFDRR